MSRPLLPLQELARHSEQLASGLRLPAGAASVLVAMEEARADEWSCQQPLPDTMTGAGMKRRDEFRAGRLAASRALNAAGVAGATWLDPAADGTPSWPAGWLGSISHSGDYAWAVAASDRSLRLVGVDIQQRMSRRQAERVRASVASDREWALLDQRGPVIATTLLFSAKEALYKALFPSVGRFFEFSAATLVAASDGGLTLCLSCDWSCEWRSGASFDVGYLLAGQYIFTVVHVVAGETSRAKHLVTME